MRSIYKYKLDPTNPDQCISLPRGAKILHVANQFDTFVFWAEVDPDAALQERWFKVYGTGHTMPDAPGVYLGTAPFMGGKLVFHAYETTEVRR